MPDAVIGRTAPMIPLSSPLLLLVLFGSALAQPQSPQLQVGASAALDELTAVNACVRHVGQLNPRPKKDFSAYIAPAGGVRVSGTAEGTLLFKQCMKDKGQVTYSN